MATKIIWARGSRKLLAFAKKKLRQLTEERRDLGLTEMSRQYKAAGIRVYLKSSEFGDEIRMKGGHTPGGFFNMTNLQYFTRSGHYWDDFEVQSNGSILKIDNSSLRASWDFYNYTRPQFFLRSVDEIKVKPPIVVHRMFQDFFTTGSSLFHQPTADLRVDETVAKGSTLGADCTTEIDLYADLYKTWVTTDPGAPDLSGNAPSSGESGVGTISGWPAIAEHTWQTPASTFTWYRKTYDPDLGYQYETVEMGITMATTAVVNGYGVPTGTPPDEYSEVHYDADLNVKAWDQEGVGINASGDRWALGTSSGIGSFSVGTSNSSIDYTDLQDWLYDRFDFDRCMRGATDGGDNASDLFKRGNGSITRVGAASDYYSASATKNVALPAYWSTDGYDYHAYSVLYGASWYLSYYGYASHAQVQWPTDLEDLYAYDLRTYLDWWPSASFAVVVDLENKKVAYVLSDDWAAFETAQDAFLAGYGGPNHDTLKATLRTKYTVEYNSGVPLDWLDFACNGKVVAPCPSPKTWTPDPPP